jgi:Family of unknown function (DUF5372)
MSTATVMRGRHPLQGRALRVLGRMRRHGRLELLLELPDGSKCLIPATWTDLAVEDDGGSGGQAPVVATLGSLEDLLAASGLVSALSARHRQSREKAARQSQPKEAPRAACAAQSAVGSRSGATPDTGRPAPLIAGRGGDHAAGQPDSQSMSAAGRHDEDGAGQR